MEEKPEVKERNKDSEQKKPEITPDIARAILVFLDRSQISGAEANTMMTVKHVINSYMVSK